MDLRAELAAVAQDPERSRRTAYAELLIATLHVRGPQPLHYAVTDPGTGRRALPAFLTAEEASRFWATAAPGAVVNLEAIGLSALAGEARQVGALVIDPMGINLVLDRSELMPLALGQIPGQFAVWLQELGRLGRSDTEVIAQLRHAHVHVITGKTSGGDPQFYLLEKSEDGTQAVPCFSSVQSLTQFAEVRRLFEGHHDYAVALVDGAYCLQAAAGMGAYVLIDPESPWEKQLEPTLL
jgi:hypothetical protein